MKENELILIVAQYKDEKKVLKAIKDSGAPAATYFYGRGTGIRQKLGFLGNFIQEEKVIYLVAVPKDNSSTVLKSIVKSTSLDSPGKGFACTLNLGETVGLL